MLIWLLLIAAGAALIIAGWALRRQPPARRLALIVIGVLIILLAMWRASLARDANGLGVDYAQWAPDAELSWSDGADTRAGARRADCDCPQTEQMSIALAKPTPSVSPKRPKPRPNRVLADDPEDADACCTWVGVDQAVRDVDGLEYSSQQWQAAPFDSYPYSESFTYSDSYPQIMEPAPARRTGTCADTPRLTQGGICFVIRNGLGERQQREVLHLFVEGRPIGEFVLEPGQQQMELPVHVTFPGRFGYRLVGYVDYPDGRRPLNSTGVVDAREAYVYDVRITEERDAVYLEIDPSSWGYAAR